MGKVVFTKLAGIWNMYISNEGVRCDKSPLRERHGVSNTCK